jgi:putative ABC transport system ATP-binding protein
MVDPVAAAPLVRLQRVELTLESGAGAVNILRGIDLDIGAGDTVAVTGASGSGKSTLMAVIGGLERPSQGRIEVAGHDLGTMDEDALALFRRRHVGIVFQSFHLIPTMTALENVAVPIELAGRADAFARAEAALKAAGLGHRVSHYPAQLSGGEQQRVAVARAFANEPALVLADEPTGNLDSTTGAAIVDLMFATQARIGCTLVLITHDTGVARRCRRHVRMEDGRMEDGRLVTTPTSRETRAAHAERASGTTARATGS